MWPTSIIFMVLVTVIIVFSVILSQSAKFNPADIKLGTNKPEFAYSTDDTRELLTNACKLPYIFLLNDDVVDGYNNWGFVCATTTLEIEDDMPTKIPFYNVAVACKRNGMVELLKPFVNFAVLPKYVHGESVAVLYLPSINHKLFMNAMRWSKRFMLEKDFMFAKIMTMKERRPLQDLLLQLGLSSETNTFQKAKQNNFSTFFSGPQQIRDLIEVDHDTMAHRNLVFQFLIDDKMCLQDGRKFSKDQLERFVEFLTATNGSKFFSTMFLDDYGHRRQDIDLDLSEALTVLEQRGVFRNTTLIVASYDLSDKEVEDEDAKNPLFSVRLSDNLMKNYARRKNVLKMNLNRLVTSSHVHHLIINLLDPDATPKISPFAHVLSTMSSCKSYGVPESLCLCMKTNKVSEFPSLSEKLFLAEVKSRFYKEVEVYECVRNIEIADVPVFYAYSNTIKGDVRVVELSAKVTVENARGNKTLPLKKTFIFEPMFDYFRSFDSVRVIINDGVNTGIQILCFL